MIISRPMLLLSHHYFSYMTNIILIAPSVLYFCPGLRSSIIETNYFKNYKNPKQITYG